MRPIGGRIAPLTCIGDSLTAGTGASGVATRYPNVLAAALAPARSFANLGVGGETSTQVAARLIAQSADDLRATHVIWAGRNNYTAPATVKADIAAMAAALGHPRWLVLSIVNGDYANEYSGQSGWTTMTTLNADLAATYGARFVDVRTPLVAAGAPAGIAPDPTNYARDVPPAGIRLDNLHLLDAGYAIVAATVAARIMALGF